MDFVVEVWFVGALGRGRFWVDCGEDVSARGGEGGKGRIGEMLTRSAQVYS